MAWCSRSGAVVKHQYVGDINDYRKYALLRGLSAGGRNRIGVCWMLTPSDGRSDGNRLAYLTQSERYRAFDPMLFDVLAQTASQPDQRRLDSIEQSGTIPGASYMDEMLVDDVAGRRDFMLRCADRFRDMDVVFFDPDNGLETSLRKGRKNSSKFLYLDEVEAFFAAGQSLLIYQHFPRVERTAFIASCLDRLRDVAPGAAIWTFSTAHVVFLLLVHPESPARLAIAAMEICGRWDPSFIRGQYVSAARLAAE